MKMSSWSFMISKESAKGKQLSNKSKKKVLQTQTNQSFNLVTLSTNLNDIQFNINKYQFSLTIKNDNISIMFCSVFASQIDIILKNKMYGINQEMMDRMERRIRQKIYKEMLDQQQKYRQSKAALSNKSRTEPDIYSNNFQQKRHSRNINEGANILSHESSFLPVINKNNREKTAKEDYSFQQKTNDEQYDRYLQRKKIKNFNCDTNNNTIYKHHRVGSNEENNQSTLQIKKLQKQPYEEDEKTQLYLEQCQHIIKNLKEITTKNHKQFRNKRNKYQVQTSNKPQYLININHESNRSTRNYQSQFPTDYESPKYQRRKSHTPKNQSFSFPEKHSWINEFSLNKSKFMPISSLNSQKYYNQFQENDIQENNVRVKENNVKISALKTQTDNQFLSQKSPEIGIKKKKIPQKSSPNGNSRKQIEKPQKLEQKQANQQANNSQLEKKRQNAILRYLKKARMRGNVLFEKIGAQKKPNKQDNGQSLQNSQQKK